SNLLALGNWTPDRRATQNRGDVAPTAHSQSTFGCFVIGLPARLTERSEVFGPGARLFLFTGLPGGFTSFSAFGLDAAFLVRRGELLVAALSGGASVVLGITAVGVGPQRSHSFALGRLCLTN